MRNWILAGLLISAAAAHGQIKSGMELYRKMHERHFEAQCRYYTFSQRNNHYENDTLSQMSVWHEAVGFPDQFRITFGAKNSGNYVHFRNDSLYRYYAGKLKKAQRDTNSLLLLLGGMYFRPQNDALARLAKAGYDVTRYSEQQWQGKPVYVLGAATGDTTSNQFWLDKNDLVIVRIIERMDSGDRMDMRFEAYQKWCKGFVETKVSFRRNGRLEQEEAYFDLKKQESFRLTD